MVLSEAGTSATFSAGYLVLGHCAEGQARPPRPRGLQAAGQALPPGLGVGLHAQLLPRCHMSLTSLCFPLASRRVSPMGLKTSEVRQPHCPVLGF